MENKELILAIVVAIIFYVLSQNSVYDFTSKYIDDQVDELGKPTQKGILVHSVIGGLLFMMVAWLVKKNIN